MPLHAGTAATAAALAIATLAALPMTAVASIVYDSLSPVSRGFWFIHDRDETSSSAELPGGFENESQAGEQITLAGADRLVTNVQIRLRTSAFVSTPITANVTLRLWEVQGASPGKQLWNGVVPITFPFGVSTFADADFAMDVLLPDTLIWTVALDDIVVAPGVNNNFGVGLHSNPVLVGGNPGGVLWQDSTTLEWHEDADAGFNLEARFTALPAPGASLLLSLGLLALGRRTRPQP